MKFLLSVFDLKIYDQDGNFINEIKDSTNGVLNFDEERESFFGISQVSFDIDMIKNIGEVVEDNRSDFEKELSGKNTTKIRLSKSKPTKFYKLVANGLLHSNENNDLEEFKVIINKARLTSGLKFDVIHDGVSELTHLFEIYDDENGNEIELEFVK